MHDTANIEQELESLLNKLTAEVENDQRQLTVIQKRLESNVRLKHALQARLNPPSNSNSRANAYGSQWERIRKAVKNLTAPFTQADIEAEMKRQNPEIEFISKRIRTALWTLQDKGDTIKQLKKGDTGSPAQYELINGENHGSPCPPPKRNGPPLRKVVPQ